ncbi:hypothetical protein ABIE79_010082 [Bradyrhizobium diazoefficiens]
MKLHALCASAVALTLAFSSPARAVEENANKMFVHMMVVTAGITLHCSEYEAIEGGARRYPDISGVDFETFGPAVGNALFANSGVDYDRDKLIPAVTQLVRADMAELGGEITKLGKSGFCRKYGRFPVVNGIMTKK